MRRKNLFLLSGVLLLLAACKKGNDPGDTSPNLLPKQEDIAVIDSKISSWLTQNKTPGISLAISKNGKLVYKKGYGVGDTETGAKVTTESRFRIASVSKLITSAAIMKLVQDGKLSMDQKVFGNAGVLGTTYGTQPYKQYVTDITVSDLLHHTMGGWGQDYDPAFFDKSMDKAAVINWTLNNLALTKKPGTAFAYSNFGYMLLAQIIERVSSKSYIQFVNDEIWKKTGATASTIAGSALPEWQTDEVKYSGQGGDLSYVYNMSMARADGAMGWLSTPTDLLKFATAVDSSATRPDILSLPTIKTMVTTTTASTGFGGMQFGCGWVIENNEWFWWGPFICQRFRRGSCI